MVLYQSNGFCFLIISISLFINHSYCYISLDITETIITEVSAGYTNTCLDLHTNVTSVAHKHYTNQNTVLYYGVGDFILKSHMFYDAEYNINTKDFFLYLNVLGNLTISQSLTSGTYYYYGCNPGDISRILLPYVQNLKIYLFDTNTNIMEENLIKMISKKTGEISYYRQAGEFYSLNDPFLPLSVSILNIYNTNFGFYKPVLQNVFDICVHYPIIKMAITGEVLINTEKNGIRYITLYDIQSNVPNGTVSNVSYVKMNSCNQFITDESVYINDTMFDCYQVVPFNLTIEGCSELLSYYGIFTPNSSVNGSNNNTNNNTNNTNDINTTQPPMIDNTTEVIPDNDATPNAPARKQHKNDTYDVDIVYSFPYGHFLYDNKQYIWLFYALVVVLLIICCTYGLKKSNMSLNVFKKKKNTLRTLHVSDMKPYNNDETTTMRRKEQEHSESIPVTYDKNFSTGNKKKRSY